jgi:hypothetical protein
VGAKSAPRKYLTVVPGTFVLPLLAFLSAYFRRIPNSQQTVVSIGSIIAPWRDCWKISELQVKVYLLLRANRRFANDRPRLLFIDAVAIFFLAQDVTKS